MSRTVRDMGYDAASSPRFYAADTRILSLSTSHRFTATAPASPKAYARSVALVRARSLRANPRCGLAYWKRYRAEHCTNDFPWSLELEACKLEPS